MIGNKKNLMIFFNIWTKLFHQEKAEEYLIDAKSESVSNCCSAPIDDFGMCTHCKEGCEAAEAE